MAWWNWNDWQPMIDWMALKGINAPLAVTGQEAVWRSVLGMTPVLQGFTGHVPESITRVIPGTKIRQTGNWSAGFSGTWFLDPQDSLFQRIGRKFVEKQTELFGTDHLYAADPFNEIDPPSNDSTFLADMGGAIYNGMHSADTSATWVIQGWFLVYARSSGRNRKPRRCWVQYQMITCWCWICGATAHPDGRCGTRSMESRGSGMCCTILAAR